MHWLLYVPGQHSRAELFTGVGLGHLSDGASVASPVRGPDGGSGAIVSWDAASKPLYKPDEQSWSPACVDRDMPAGRYFVGLWNGKPPTPKECEKPHPVRGKAIKFGDGQFWTVPKAIDVPYTMVPRLSGGWDFAPLRQYASWLITVDEWRQRCDEAKPGDGFPFVEIAEFVLESLAINYRLTREVAGALELFRSGEGECLLDACLSIVALHREVNP